MREAVGGGLLFNLVVIFASIIILLFVAIIAYAKAYTVKNKIVSIVEEYGGYSKDAINDINTTLKDIGYKNISKYPDTDSFKKRCGELLQNKYGIEYSEIGINAKPDFLYCVAKKEESNGYYYAVVTFVTFEFPVIGDVVNYPVYGQTRILGKTYDYD